MITLVSTLIAVISYHTASLHGEKMLGMYQQTKRKTRGDVVGIVGSNLCCWIGLMGCCALLGYGLGDNAGGCDCAAERGLGKMWTCHG